MVWTIPNTFVAGTKARANEVNENFTSIKQFVDTLEVQASTNEIDITNLTNTKANTNGNNQERFQVANPTASYDAVNLQTLESKTLNSRSVIDGFTLSKFNNNTITATAGNCYDSTYVYMISSATSLQESATLGANATYYVYVCADSDTNTCELVFNTSPTTPELPANFDYFRRIGRFITNSNSQIDRVYSEMSQPISTDEKLTASGYVKLTNGLIFQWGVVSMSQGSKSVSLPISFTKSFFNIQVTSNHVQGQGTDRQRGLIGAYVNGLSSFTIESGAGLSPDPGWQVFYFAIGV